MNKLEKFLLAFSITLTVFAVCLIVSSTPKTFASAASGLKATLATTSAEVLPSQTVTTIIATSTNCAARVISTTDKEIMLTLDDSQNLSPTATFGYKQLASTTVAYDSGIYGCGRVKVYSYGATNITVGESR